MRTEYVKIKGKGKWVRVFQPNKYGKWSLDLYPVGADLEIMKKLKDDGVRNHLKKDDDGYYMTLSRPLSKEIRGKLTPFSPPIVLDSNGAPMEPTPIGNGSDIVVKLEVYGGKHPASGNWKAARLLSLKVENLVPFNTETDFEEEERAAASGLEKTPPADEW